MSAKHRNDPPRRFRPRTHRPFTISLTPAPACPCGKLYYPTEQAAKEAHKLRHPDPDPARFYECPSGGWHWTTDITRAGRSAN